jgi:hypothetical protein
MGLQKCRQAERTIGEVEVMAGVRCWIPSRCVVALRVGLSFNAMSQEEPALQAKNNRDHHRR